MKIIKQKINILWNFINYLRTSDGRVGIIWIKNPHIKKAT